MRREPSWLVERGLIPQPGPGRIIAAASFVNMLGTAMFTVSSAIFYTQVVGLTVAKVGLGMGIGVLVGMLSGLPVGRLADRRGAREVYVVTLAAQAVAMAALVFVRSFELFVILVSASALAQTASQAARGPIVRRFAGEKPAKFRAYLRSTAMLASSVGAAVAALAVQVNTPAVYVGLIMVNAASYLVSAAFVSRLPHLRPLTASAGTGRWAALKDYPFMVLTVLDGVMSMQGRVLTFALPLWIVSHTSAPRWFVGIGAFVNTGLIVLLQVRASRRVETNAGAVRAWRRSGWALLAGMALIGLTGGLPGWAAVTLMTAGVVLYSVGGMWQAAGSFELRYNLAPAHAQGQYSGVFLLGSNVVGVVAPSVLGFLCVTWGGPGWWVLGGVFAAAGLAVPAVVRWAERA